MKVVTPLGKVTAQIQPNHDIKGEKMFEKNQTSKPDTLSMSVYRVAFIFFTLYCYYWV